MDENPASQWTSAAQQAPQDAKFFWTGGPVEVAADTWFASLGSGVTAFATRGGLVLVDTGARLFAGGIADRIRTRTDLPVHTAIYTHGHIDHAFGLESFLVEGQGAPQVVAQERMAERFARYERSPRHNATVNSRQFGGREDDPTFQGEELRFGFPTYEPTRSYQHSLELDVGGTAFELHACRGETDDHTWIYCPERRVLCTGDLIIWGVPNAGNPQKAQRYPWDWAAGLRAMAETGAASLCPGHGGPVVNDPRLVRRILQDTAAFLEEVVERTLAVLEDGSPPHVDVVRRVELPRSEAPWLQPVYDEAEFIVRNVIRYYGGWWSGRPSELKPAPRADVAAELAALSGGPGRLLDRAVELAPRNMALACHLADYALEAAPDNPVIAEGVAALYTDRGARESSLMATNLYRSAAAGALSRLPSA
ncbi:alkyl sulfatase dimerization domain-containing protein [Streptomyces sp. B-S-A8]|uniref:Alkyl sulfatase dimerization domain-containing protein n=1 Tax=Streptomyces solicavernae TaxID=3043614 RepID=A0ABT6S2R6_9ACTN|nr:alkyl sulfatase dimerization domain-containing protein [Streptomyces sp. B-S-A8]MDI3390308.1 alkyl sulfatase dimerization domain-containing protein [Streptomyces sp. B-S-A8]